MTNAASIRASVLWSVARNWGIRLSSVVLFFVLARILPLSQLGLFSAAVSIVAIAELFAENGIGDAVVQAPELDERQLSAALIVNLLAGALCVAALIGAAPWLENWFDAPGLAPILSVAALAILMNALSYIPQSLLRRRLEFRWLATRSLTASLVAGAVGIGLALAGFGVIALVVQFLLQALINLVLIWVVRPFRPRPAPLRAAAPLLRFGSHVFAGKGLDYAAGRSVELAILAGLGPAPLALYILASRLWAVMMQLISAVTIDVSLPVFSRLADDRTRLLESFYAAIRMTFGIGVPAFVLLAALAPEVMPVIFGSNGRGGEALLLPLALLGAVQVIQFYNGVLLIAIGRPGDSMRINLVRALTVVAVLVVSFGRSLETVVIAFSLAHIAVTPVYFWYGSRRVGLSVGRVVRTGAPFVAAAAMMFGTIWLVRPLVLAPLPSPLLRGLVLGALGAIVFVAIAIGTDRRAVGGMMRDIAGRGRRREAAE